MPLVLKDRVKETTTTVSTGTYALAGAVVGYQAFSVIGNGNTTYYAVTNGTDWEVGIGTYTLSGTTLSRDTILESSNSGNAVNWSAGVKEIFCTYPAERSAYSEGGSLASGLSTFFATPSSANLAAAMTDETGSGLLVFATTPVVTGLREKSAAIAASDIDLSLGNYFTKTISGTTTFTVSNVATSGDVSAFVLVLTNGGSATVNWFSGVTWDAGTPPTLTTSGIDILAFFTINGGTTWRGLVLAQAVA
jgi:hypothetical protein